MSLPVVNSYLFFNGRCEEALEFYKKAIGAKPGMIVRNNQSPEPPPPGTLPPGFENKILHCDFTIGNTMLFASDGCEEQTNFNGFRLALTVATEEEAEKAFNALAEGGKVDMPLMKTFFSPKYGMLTDKFGLGWMIMVPGQEPPKV